VNSICISFKLDAGSETRIANAECQSEMTESLLARTLYERIKGLGRDDSIHHMEGWFRTVRQMGVANWIAAGIETEVKQS
jgi:hypothetical protein